MVLARLRSIIGTSRNGNPDMNPLSYLRTVLWSFIGIRRGAGARHDLATLRPVPLLLTGFTLAALFVGLLLALAHWAAAGLA
jgi:hypothetical protein